MRDPTISGIYVLIVYFFGPFDLFKFGSFLTHGPANNEKSARFISFDSNNGEIDLELNIAVPFLTIPLKNSDIKKGTADRPSSLVTINTKGIAVLGILLATSAFIVPLFIKSIPQVHQNYRMDEDLQWWNIGHTVNDVLLCNGYVTPCVQRILCSLVNEVKRSENPTHTGKMIDSIFSHRWFQQYANSSVILDAVKTGEGTEKDCPTVYKGCFLNQKMIDNSLKALSII